MRAFFEKSHEFFAQAIILWILEQSLTGARAREFHLEDFADSRGGTVRHHSEREQARGLLFSDNSELLPRWAGWESVVAIGAMLQVADH